MVSFTKPEFFLLEYNKFNKPCKVVRRFVRDNLLVNYERLKIFFYEWLKNDKKREYIDVEFEPDMNVPLRNDIFNLFFGLKIEMIHDIQSYDYDPEKVNPFVSHITDVFCKGNKEHADYLLNWIASIVQKPSKPNIVCVVIKSEKQGVGKGLIFDTLLGDGIFGDESYVQVNNVDGLLGRFNSELINKLLINVNEVSMTKKEANSVKSMITDPKMKGEAKFLNKLTVRNCANYVMTSNNDYCVYIDEGFGDRRYFIVEADCSRANDQTYYGEFVQYCQDPKVHLEVYKFLKSRDLTGYNARIIIETEEKAKYRMKAIPLPIQFVQYYIEQLEFATHPAHNTWEYKHEFRYETLYQVFVEYQHRMGITKHISINTFRDCISKRLKPEVSRRTREDGFKIRYYTFGNDPQDVIECLKKSGLYNEDL